MWTATIKSLLAHKLRLALTGVAIILGVAFMAGTYVLTDTVGHTFDALFQQTTAGQDIVVRATAPYGTSRGFGNEQGKVRPTVPANLVATVRSVPGVRLADGGVGGEIQMLGRNGKVLTSHAPTLAFSWTPDRQLSAFVLRQGHAPGPGQVVLDTRTVRNQHWQLGDRVVVLSSQGRETFTLVGVTGFGSADNLAGATVAGFDGATAQRLLGEPGQWDQIAVAVVPGTNIGSVQASLTAVLPRGIEAVSARTVADENAQQIKNGFLKIFSTVLLAFALIALFVGSFIIYNTFSILVTQRTRELALLRALGASRRQVTRSVVLEASVVGLVSSVIGLGAGVGLAAGFMALLSAIGVSLPNAGLTIIPRTVIVSIVVGTIVAVVAAIIPARRAANVPPVAAMREDMAILQRSLRRRTVSGAVVGVIGVILLGIGLFGHPSNPAASVGAGAALTFLAVAMLSPWVVVPLSRILGAPLATVQGIAGKLGRENAIRNPRRTASTAAALTVGLALVSVVATLASSVTASTGHLIDRTIKADYIVASSDFAPFSPTVARRLAAAPGIAAASPLREGTWHDGTAGKTLTAVDPATARDVLNLTMTSGSFDALARGELLISDKSAKSHHVAVGGTLPMGFTDTGVQHLTVGGTFSSSDTGFVDSYVVSLAVYDRNYTNPQDLAVLVKTSLPPSQAQAAVAGAVSDFPNVSVKDQRQFKDSYKRRIGTVLNIVYVLLAFSVLIAIVGIVNTLALSVIERTRELGLLRAVGMVRRQVRRMVRGEAILVSLIGAILGVVVGEALAIALLHALHSTGLTAIAIPWGTLIGVVILGAVAGVFAAIWPARRAARLDVLAAIATS